MTVAAVIQQPGAQLFAGLADLLLSGHRSTTDSVSQQLKSFVPDEQVAHLGVTVAAVIHQPGAQLFAGLDDLLLLGRGGRTVYYGQQDGVQSYFQSIGFRLPEQVLPLLGAMLR